MRKTKVVVLLSGGVDSSVAAALVQKQGFEVIGLFAKTWSQPIAGVEHCPWIEDRRSAQRVAAKLDIPFYTVNVEREYHDKVIDNFFAEYKAGRTPNPDVICNREIKFGVLLDFALSLGAEFVATGHYARCQRAKSKSKIKSSKSQNKIQNYLLRGVDDNKDQSYFLWDIKREALPKLIFPIGEYRKLEVRKLATRFGLPTAERNDSQGICFLGPVSVDEFLKSKIKTKTGRVVLNDGMVVGKHNGVEFYTIGQRSGWEPIKNNKSNIIKNKQNNILEINETNKPPLYVIEKDLKNNILIVGAEDDPKLYRDEVIAESTNWLIDNPKSYFNKTISCQIRYRQHAVGCKIVKEGRSVRTVFDQPIRAVTAGQSIVWYDKDKLLGGGIISQ